MTPMQQNLFLSQYSANSYYAGNYNSMPVFTKYGNIVAYAGVVDTLISFRDINTTKAIGMDYTNFVYIESDFLKSVRYGWIVALEEPTIIRNPAVLAGLNSLFDSSGEIRVDQTGETINVHPDFLCIMTTNLSYAGCKSINASVLSRCGLKIEVNTPSQDVVIERLLKETSAIQKVELEKMYNVIIECDEKIKEFQLPDSVCSYRELKNWVMTSAVTGDIVTSFYLSVLPCISMVQDEQLTFTAILEKYYS